MLAQTDFIHFKICQESREEGKGICTKAVKPFSEMTSPPPFSTRQEDALDDRRGDEPYQSHC